MSKWIHIKRRKATYGIITIIALVLQAIIAFYIIMQDTFSILPVIILLCCTFVFAISFKGYERYQNQLDTFDF